MGQEIERKFLVVGDEWRSHACGTPYRQGYIPTHSGVTVRVRIAGEMGYLTLKGLTSGISRSEFEYAIPVEDAKHMLDELCDRPLIEKTRYRLSIEGTIWEVDEFEGENRGLILAEVELTHPNQSVSIPGWVGQEVSNDPRYFNAYLANHPFSQWG
ncbi:MAG: CYTH domain-containing protein [Elainellaceae cyanobacterium]